jgi:hypothetical protein
MARGYLGATDKILRQRGHGMSQHPKETEMAHTVDNNAWEQSALRRGLKVLTIDVDEIGEVEEVLHQAGSTYLHVVRYGSGHDDLYIPLSAVVNVVADHVYVSVTAGDLIGQAWHELPR